MKSQILSLLNESTRPLKKRELMAKFPQLTEREVRKIIEELIMEGEMIEASERGYEMIRDYQGVRRARQYLTEKMEALAIRRSQLEQNWREKHQVKQSTLFG